MMMKKMRWVILGMAALSVTATVAAAQNGGVGRTVDAIQSVLSGFFVQGDGAANLSSRADAQSATDYRWSGRMDTGETLEIKGINGSIEVGLASGREVVVTAESRARRSNPESVRVERVEHRDGLTFCAVYPTPSGKRENECRPGSEGRMNTENNDVVVDFRVEVPAGITLSVRTVNGEIEVRDIESDVYANTVNGDVEISTTGFAEARTVNGSIDARMGSFDLRSGASFTTVNGSISLDLHDDVDADLDASWLNGGFESDLPFALQGRLTRRSARGTLGDGGPQLELKTVNGSIRIR